MSRKAVWGAALALWVMIPGANAFAAGESGKIDKLLQDASASGAPRSVIIRTKAGTKASVRKRLPNRGDGPGEHNLIQALTARLDAKEIKALAANPDVLSISDDAEVNASGAVKAERRGSKGAPSSTTTETTRTGNDPFAVSPLEQSLGMDNWFSGSSVTVAVIDSGIQNGTDFSGRIVGFYDFTAGKGAVATTPSDEYGHGTHVAGLIGSSGASSNGKYAGIASGVKLLGLKVLNKQGSGRTSSVISALEFAVANKERFNIGIVNVSLGHPIYEPAATDPLVQAVEAAVRSGLIVVVAAGNNGTNPKTGLIGYAGIASPGNAPSAITVGAANTGGTLARTDDRVTSYSSRGPSWYDGVAKPDVLAPGHHLISNRATGSTLAVNYPSLMVKEGGARFLMLNGSSMATGVVSGLIAVMLDANRSGAWERWALALAGHDRAHLLSLSGAPTLTPNAIKAMLQYSATPLRNADGVRYDVLTQGSGLINGLGASVMAYRADTTKAAGAFWMAGSWPVSTPFGGVEEPWSQSVIWGTRMVHGSSLMDFNQAAWDDNIVWGTGELDNIVWGTLANDDDDADADADAADDDDNIVWGTSLLGDNLVWGTSILNEVFWSGNASLGDNIVWGTNFDWADNIVWGTNLIGVFDGDNIVWGTMFDGADNIVWGTLDDDNIVWGTSANKVSVLGTSVGGGL